MPRIKRTIVICLIVLLIFGIMTYTCISLHDEYSRILIQLRKRQFMQFGRNENARVQHNLPSKVKKDKYIPFNLTKTCGHLELHHEETLFQSEAQWLGIADPWKSRLRLLQMKCKAVKELKHPVKDSRFMFSNKHNFSFCKAPKTGSTFMINLFRVLELGHSIEGVFKQQIRDNTHFDTMKYLSAMAPSNARYKKILVTRDPYSRLFSAYVDKVLMIGFRLAHTEVARQSGFKPYLFKGEQCGYITSFQDFLDAYLSREIETSDEHWRPIAQMCDVCAVDFQLIINTETLTNDTEFILDQIELDDHTKSDIMSMLRHSKNTRGVIHGLVKDYMKYSYIEINKCGNVVPSMYRMWEGFKILGYIKKSTEFPEARFRAVSSRNTTIVLEIIFDSMEKSPLNKREKYQQKRDAIVAAYQQVTQQTIDKIKEYYKFDFFLFGYDKDPPLH